MANQAKVQQLPGVSWNNRPTPFETFAQVFSAGLQGEAGRKKADQEMRSAEIRSSFPALVQEGYVKPSRQGQPGAFPVGGMWFQAAPQGTGYKQQERDIDLDLKKATLQDKLQDIGELPKSNARISQDAVKAAMNSNAYQMATMDAQTNPTPENLAKLEEVFYRDAKLYSDIYARLEKERESGGSKGTASVKKSPKATAWLARWNALSKEKKVMALTDKSIRAKLEQELSTLGLTIGDLE